MGSPQYCAKAHELWEWVNLGIISREAQELMKSKKVLRSYTSSDAEPQRVTTRELQAMMETSRARLESHSWRWGDMELSDISSHIPLSPGEVKLFAVGKR